MRIRIGNNLMVGATVACAVAVEEVSKMKRMNKFIANLVYAVPILSTQKRSSFATAL